MLLDGSHRRWAIVTAMLTAVATATYVVYAFADPRGPRGGSWTGLAFGVASLALMIYPALLGLRRRVPTWRVGRASTWLRGHLWLGLLGYVLVFYHAGFQWNGTLTAILMVLYTVVVLSGIWGVVVQQRVPTMMLEQVPLETVYEQIDAIVGQLRTEADELVGKTAGEMPVASGGNAAGSNGVTVYPHAGNDGGRHVEPALMVAGVGERSVAALHDAYVSEIRPFLDRRLPGRSPLLNARERVALFDHLRTLVPPTAHEVVEALRAICEERRQLAQQKRLHHVLHGWLLVHVPLSLALLVLAIVHAIVALRY